MRRKRGGGWGGSATIEITISRWVNRDTGEVRVEEPEMTEEEEEQEALAEVHEEEPLWSEQEFTCEITASAYSEPDTYWEPGGSDFEVTDFKSDCPIVSSWDDLTSSEQSSAQEDLCSSIKSDDGGYEPDYDYDGRY